MEPKKGIDNTSSTTHLIQLQFLIYQCQPPVQAFFGFHLFFYLHTVSGLPLLVATALISWTSAIQTQIHESLWGVPSFFPVVALFKFFLCFSPHEETSGRFFLCSKWEFSMFSLGKWPYDNTPTLGHLHPCVFLFLPSQPRSRSPVQVEAVAGWERSTRAQELIAEFCLYHVIWLFCGIESAYCSIIKFIRKPWGIQWELCANSFDFSFFLSKGWWWFFISSWIQWGEEKRQQQKDRQFCYSQVGM